MRQHIQRNFFSWYLTKYLTREVVFSFVFGTLIFLMIMLTFQAIRLSEFVVGHQVPLKDVGRLTLSLMLSFLPIAIPIAFLFSVLMGISRANSEGEILALQAGGVGLLQIFAPVGIFSFFVSLLCLYTSLFTVPQGNRSFEMLITKLANERVIAALKPGVFIEGFYGLMLFTEHIVPLRNEMKRVFIYDQREDTHPLAITAQAGILRSGTDKGLLTLRLTNGSIHVENRDNTKEILQKIDFDVYDINLALGERGEAWRDYSPPSYNYNQLVQRIKETEPDPPVHRMLLVELHRRFSMSFSCLVFGALGFFIGTLSQRGVRSTAVILCLFVALLYWSGYLAASALATSGAIAPWFGVWIPNFVFAFVAYFCYRNYARM